MSLRAKGHEAVTSHHQHTCNMHQMGSLKSMTQALVFGEHPIQWPSHLSTAPYTTHLTAAGLPPFVYMDARLSWISLHRKPGFSSCCLHQKLKEDRYMMARTQCPGKGLDHSIQCVCYGNKGIVSPGEGRQGEKMLFHSWRYLKCLKPSDRVVACCADRSQHVDMTCITTAKRFPKTREKVSILSAGLTLLSNALMLNQSNWVWAQQKSMRSLSSPMSNTHTLTSLPKRFSYYPLWTKILNVFIQFLQKVLLYLLLISIFRTLWKPTEHLSCQDYMCVTHKYLKITDVIQKILPE